MSDTAFNAAALSLVELRPEDTSYRKIEEPPPIPLLTKVIGATIAIPLIAPYFNDASIRVHPLLRTITISTNFLIFAANEIHRDNWLPLQSSLRWRIEDFNIWPDDTS